MTPARLLKHLNKLKDQLVRTSNRVEKTLGVLQDARNHAQQRMAQLEEVRRDDIHLDGNCMSAEESDLVAAGEHPSPSANPSTVEEKCVL